MHGSLGLEIRPCFEAEDTTFRKPIEFLYPFVTFRAQMCGKINLPAYLTISHLWKRKNHLPLQPLKGSNPSFLESTRVSMQVRIVIASCFICHIWNVTNLLRGMIQPTKRDEKIHGCYLLSTTKTSQYAIAQVLCPHLNRGATSKRSAKKAKGQA